VNYGFIPGTRSGDGLEVDVYLVGWSCPLREADAVIVAIVERLDDVEDKLIGVPRGTLFTREELALAVAFQERHFKTLIRM